MIGVFRGFGADRDHQLMSLQVFYETLLLCHQVLVLLCSRIIGSTLSCMLLA